LLWDKWHTVAVPAIFRIVGGKPAPPTGCEDGFDAELEAYVSGPEAWEAIRGREGNN
jgi:hypothetical protein